MSAPKVVFSDPQLRIAVDQDLCVVRWLDSPLPMHFDEVLAAFQNAARATGKGSMLSVVDAPGKLPRFDEPVRAAARRMSNGMQPISHAISHVILMEGFTGATVRMFVSTLTLLSRASAPNHVSGALADGITWLAKEMGQNDGGARIDAAYAALR